jgi:hypothetical protein
MAKKYLRKAQERLAKRIKAFEEDTKGVGKSLGRKKPGSLKTRR